MNVLIIDFDLASSRGGGQTAYVKLIAKLPSHRFYFFSRYIHEMIEETANTTVIPYKEFYLGHDSALMRDFGPFYQRYVAACQFAESVKLALGPMHFDVVDVPDYTTDAIFIRQALAAHGVTVGVLALALHGTISHAFEGDWNPAAIPRHTLNEIYSFERTQYECCDVRYALSEVYAEQWERATGQPSRRIDPLHIVGPFTAASLQTTTDGDKPDLITIGRREQRKGADLAIDLAWAIGSENYRRLRIIGGESVGITGMPSRPILERAARLRRLSVEIVESVPFADLEAMFRARTIVVVPSRVDSFNLVALEALRLGCPIFVSREAGVSRWIETHYPELSDLVIDLGCGRSAADTIRGAAQHYDAFRTRIVEAITRKPLIADDADLAVLYEPLGPGDAALRRRLDRLAARFQRDHAPAPRIRFAPLTTSSADAPGLTPLTVAPAVEAAAQRAHHVAVIDTYGGRLRSMKDVLPKSDGELRNFIAFFSEAIGIHRTARVDLFGQMAAMERIRQRHLTAALYDLRAMRCFGEDRLGCLPEVTRVFRSEGFLLEADVVEAMYADPDRAHERCAAIIDDRYKHLLIRPQRPFEFIDDRRGEAEPKVAVIASLYSAASKLPTLLENISIQTMAHNGLVEVILVDSGSPTNEYAIFKELGDNLRLPVVFARSRERETIQAAWNRGIELARAPYLCFYGVDEGMHPDCLQRLSRVLDDEPSVDWVMSNSLVTDVDAAGVFAADVMEYRRDGLDREMVYLETCYLSWVGGLYRRSIHERFGYYDESFRAAGDTEFKCRILSRIEIKHVPQVLGVFNNYPEERTTAHPRAEIEDLRAWYLHRTSAGMANLFDGRNIAAAEGLFRRCLGYRKSYCEHLSTDFDLAAAIVSYMERRGDNPGFASRARASLSELTRTMVMIDSQSLRAPTAERQADLIAAFERLSAEADRCSSTFELAGPLEFRLFNDNRFEQHWWSWSA